MSKTTKSGQNQLLPQPYPRLPEGHEFAGYVDDNALQPHIKILTKSELKEIILKGIVFANQKSSRTILKITDDMPPEEVESICIKEGIELFKYFLKYCGDPAATAHQCLNQKASTVAKDQFRNRSLQKERMNSGWRYQNIAKDAANKSKRFYTVSDIGGQEADFNAQIKILDTDHFLNIYVSVKNRSTTVGGQDLPKSIQALEKMASSDKNRSGPYLCVFGIAMESGKRNIRKDQQKKRPYSVNTEIWPSDLFWPFFTNLSYEEIMTAVLDALMNTQEQDQIDISIPSLLLTIFEKCCHKYNLLDQNGKFCDAYSLLKLFVSPPRISTAKLIKELKQS